MSTDFCMCDNDHCPRKTSCKRWQLGTDKRNALRWWLTTYNYDYHTNYCKHYQRYDTTTRNAPRHA